MKRRACIASSDLPDYEDPDDPSTGNCTNPIVRAVCMTVPETWSVRHPRTTAAMDPLRDPTLHGDGDAHLRLPSVRAVQHPLRRPPDSGCRRRSTFERDSTFAMTDIDLATRRHDDSIAFRTARRSSPQPRSGARRVRPRRAGVLPAPLRDHRGRSLHLLLRGPEQRDARGRAVRDRQRRQLARRVRPGPPADRQRPVRRRTAATSSSGCATPRSASSASASPSTPTWSDPARQRSRGDGHGDGHVHVLQPGAPRPIARQSPFTAESSLVINN